MKTLILMLIIAIILLAGCQRSTPRYAAKPIPTYESTITSTTSTTTIVFDCKSCQAGTICRNNECIKVEFSNIGGSGSGSSSGY